MARFDNRYSRIIAVIKILLPLAALMLLSSLFLLSRPAPTGQAIPFSDVGINELAREKRLGAPIYRGVTETGSEVEVMAEKLRPDLTDPDLTHATKVVANVLNPDGFSYVVTGETGLMNEASERADLTDGVVIVTSNDYTITTEAVWLTTDMSYLETYGDVHAVGPIGTLDAGRLQMLRDPVNNSDLVAVFTGGVKLVYYPDQD